VQVVGITGMPGSGKSEAMAVAKARGLPVFRMGDLIWEEVERRGLPRDAQHVGQIANAMRQEQGMDVWAKRTVEAIRRVHADAAIVLIDGVRNGEEVAVFRAAFGDDFTLVAIHTDPEERFQRMTRRGRADDAKDDNAHRQRDDREMGWGIARTIALADEMLVNDGTLADLQTRVAALLDRL
jgi:dephospho-CoA kinase